jgi:hypothetical protein
MYFLVIDIQTRRGRVRAVLHFDRMNILDHMSSESWFLKIRFPRIVFGTEMKMSLLGSHSTQASDLDTMTNAIRQKPKFPKMEGSDEEIEDEVMVITALQLAQVVTVPSVAVPRLLGLRNPGSERYFDAIYASDNGRVFRDSFRMSRHTFDLLFERCLPHLPHGVRDARKVLAVTLDWFGSASVCRKQETTFGISYSTVHSYRMWSMKAIILALYSLIRMPTHVPASFIYC